MSLLGMSWCVLFVETFVCQVWNATGPHLDAMVQKHTTSWCMFCFALTTALCSKAATCFHDLCQNRSDRCTISSLRVLRVSRTHELPVASLTSGKWSFRSFWRGQRKIIVFLGLFGDQLHYNVWILRHGWSARKFLRCRINLIVEKEQRAAWNNGSPFVRYIVCEQPWSDTPRVLKVDYKWRTEV
jgi:hypothetical protein